MLKPCRPNKIVVSLVAAFTFVPAILIAAEPASPGEAAKVFDISKLALMPEHEKPNQQRVAGLSYLAKGTVKAAAEFHKKQIVGAKFKELPGGYSSDQTVSAMYGRDGYTLSLVVSEGGEPGKVFVNIVNHGNVELGKLPLPKGSKSIYVGPTSAIYTATDSVEKTRATVKEMLAKAGWVPYGEGEPVRMYRNRGVLLTVMIDASPAQMGKTSISYSTTLVSVEIPAPPESENIQYSDNLTQLYLETALSEEEVVKFYREKLGEIGWKSTTDNPIKDGFEKFIIFSSPGKDLMNIKLRDVEGKQRVELRHQTAEEVKEEERLFKEALKKKEEGKGKTDNSK